MDMNIGEMTSSVRLTVRSTAALAGRMAAVKDFFRKNGIRTVYLRDGKAGDGGAAAARLLRDEFKVIIECNASAYRLLSKEPPENRENIVLQPVYDIGDSVAELRKIVSLLPLRNGPVSLHIENAEMITDRKRITKAFGAIMKEIGQKNVKFTWDCGFVLCDFSENELGYFIQKKSEVLFTCPSLVNVDTHLNITLCGQMKGMAAGGRGTPDTALADVMNTFMTALLPFRSFGIHARCGACSYFQKVCAGGCRAVVMRNFQ